MFSNLQWRFTILHVTAPYFTCSFNPGASLSFLSSFPRLVDLFALLDTAVAISFSPCDITWSHGMGGVLNDALDKNGHGQDRTLVHHFLPGGVCGFLLAWDSPGLLCSPFTFYFFSFSPPVLFILSCLTFLSSIRWRLLRYGLIFSIWCFGSCFCCCCCFFSYLSQLFLIFVCSPMGGLFFFYPFTFFSLFDIFFPSHYLVFEAFIAIDEGFKLCWSGFGLTYL